MGRLRIFLPASFASRKGQNRRTIEKITIRLMPRTSFGMVFMSWYGARKYHAGRISCGVVKGSAGILASGGRNRFGKKVRIKKRTEK